MRLNSERYVFSHTVSVETFFFLNLEVQRSQYIRPKVIVHKCAETIQGRKLFKGGNYTRKYGISILLFFSKNHTWTRSLFQPSLNSKVLFHIHCNKISPKSRSSQELTTSICLYLRKHLLDSRTDLEDPFPDLASQWLGVVSYDLVAYTQIQNGNHFLASRSCLV